MGAALIAIVLALGAGAWAKTGNPVERLDDSWQQFKSLDTQAGQGQSRFSTGGTNRYDFWVVAWDLFGEHPVRGVGADGFQPYYLRQGKSVERPRYAHSLELGVLAQTGLVGALLAFGAMAALLAAAVQGDRKGYAPVGAAAGAAGAAFAYWFLHGSVDWFWEFAGLGAPGAGHAGAGRRPGPARQLAPAPAPAAHLVAAGAACWPPAAWPWPWPPSSWPGPGSPTWRSTARPRPGAARPTGAFKRLDRARKLNPMSAQADLSAGTIALRLGRLDQAERSFRRARDARARERVRPAGAGRDRRRARRPGRGDRPAAPGDTS